MQTFDCFRSGGELTLICTAPKAPPQRAGSMAEFVDSLLLAGTTWEALLKRASAEAKKRGTATLSTLGQIKAHVKYREKQAKWAVQYVGDTGVRMNAVAQPAPKAKPQSKAKPAAKPKNGKPTGRRVVKKQEAGRQTVTEPVAEPTPEQPAAEQAA